MARFDIHFHVLGNDTDWYNAQAGNALYYETRDNEHWFTALVKYDVELQLGSHAHMLGLNGKLTTDTYFEIARRTLMRSTEIDHIVLLALDLVVGPDGQPDKVKTDLYVPNTFLAGRIKELNKKLAVDGFSNKRFLLGASVNPNRPDWSARLDEAATLGAALVKVIPSVMHVNWSQVDKAYFDKLKALKLPLLAHVGAEYAFPEGRRKKALDDIKLLEHPLAAGVKVIAAHCGAPLFPGDADYIEELAGLMGKYNKGSEPLLWADDSALTMLPRVETTKRVLERIPGEFLLHGSDFPVESDALPFSPASYPKMPWSTYEQLLKEHNPLDRDARIKRAIGFPEAALGRPAAVLRLG